MKSSRKFTVSGSVRILQRSVEMGFLDIILYRIQYGEKPGRLQTITILWKLDTKSRIHRYNLVVFFVFEVFCGEKIHLFKLLQRT